MNKKIIFMNLALLNLGLSLSTSALSVNPPLAYGGLSYLTIQPDLYQNVFVINPDPSAGGNTLSIINTDTGRYSIDGSGEFAINYYWGHSNEWSDINIIKLRLNGEDGTLSFKETNGPPYELSCTPLDAPKTTSCTLKLFYGVGPAPDE